MNKLIALSIPLLLGTSCSISYYQVFQTESTNLKRENNILVYEDSVCQISYDLYANKGNAGFSIYNKTDKTIVIDLGQSFFIVNNEAYDYFLNRSFTNFASNSLGKSSGIGYSSSAALGTTTSKTISNNLNRSTSSGSSNTYTSSSASSNYSSTTRGNEVSYSEQQFVKIPAKSSKSFFEYNIVGNRLSICDLNRDPSYKKPDSLSFTNETSPLVFENRITYLTDSLFTTSTTINNTFYITKIINMVENDFYRLDYTYGTCSGKKSLEKSEIPKYDSPANFYIKYTIDY